MAQYQHENHESPLGIGFTCIEDVYPPQQGEKNDG